jgi:hypothetical protein
VKGEIPVLLTAADIIAKIASFIAEKTLGKTVGLAADKRRKACRAVTKLYYCLQALDDVTQTLLLHLDGNTDASSFCNALLSNEQEIELATNMFIDLSYELQNGLEIIDPPLANCCHLLYLGKFDFLTMMSRSVEWEGHGSAAVVTIKCPPRTMGNADMEEMYRDAANAVWRGEKYYWPNSAFDDYCGDWEEIKVSFSDSQAAAGLQEMIIRQNALLKAAKEKLRCLICAKFSLEEVLFQSDTHPYL